MILELENQTTDNRSGVKVALGVHRSGENVILSWERAYKLQFPLTIPECAALIAALQEELAEVKRTK